MYDLVLIKMLKISFWSEKKFPAPDFGDAEFVMMWIFFWLKFDMSFGKRACCIFK